jgi:uncharacterized protein
VLISGFITPDGVSAQLLEQDLEAACSLITVLPQVRVVEGDPNDDVVIACALQARADYIVTRDKDLLSLGGYQGILIVTPREFIDLLEGSSAG